MAKDGKVSVGEVNIHRETLESDETGHEEDEVKFMSGWGEETPSLILSMFGQPGVRRFFMYVEVDGDDEVAVHCWTGETMDWSPGGEEVSSRNEKKSHRSVLMNAAIGTKER